MNVGEIKSRVYRTFGDESGTFLQDVDFYSWLNEGCRKIYRRTRSIKVSGAINLISGISVYGLPADCYAFDKLTYKSDMLKPIHFGKVTFNTALDMLETPHGMYAINGRDLIINASGVVDGEVLRMYYSSSPAYMEFDTDIPDVPEQYHDLLITYCLARAHEMSESFNITDRYDNIFNMGVTEFRGDENSIANETYPQIQCWEE